MEKRIINFLINSTSGVPAYLQIKNQVSQALRLGYLLPGDQLPTVKEVVGTIAINPNTVFKAYRELEFEGLVETRQGQGTFITKSLLPDETVDIETVRQHFELWLKEAKSKGLSWEEIEAVINSVLIEVRYVED